MNSRAITDRCFGAKELADFKKNVSYAAFTQATYPCPENASCVGGYKHPRFARNQPCDFITPSFISRTVEQYMTARQADKDVTPPLKKLCRVGSEPVMAAQWHYMIKDSSHATFADILAATGCTTAVVPAPSYGHGVGFVGPINDGTEWCFAVLGVPESSPWAVVESTYRRLALKCHPDRPNGSVASFQELQRAFRQAASKIGAT